jgi:phage shock protein PspC (stress-responsive transcriptional regulator)
MNKVITINLNGVAYQLEEGGYDALRAYLDNAARRLEGNPDKEEILADIEQAIGDKFRAVLGSYKTVVNSKEVASVLAEMGPVESDEADAAAQAARGSPPPSGTSETGGATTAGVRRLYRIYPEGAMLSGVCNGLGAYFGLDPTLFRIAFVLLAFLWTIGIWAYVIMVLLVPLARTPTEKAAAAGMAATAQEFIKRAREGYYEGMKSFHDKEARRAWKRKFRHEMRALKYGFRRQVAEQWRMDRQAPWAQQPPPIFGPVFVAPLLSLLLFALACGLVYALYTLVTAHAVFGWVLPAAMPLWAGILLVIAAYLLVAWPLKAMRWACYLPGHHHGSGPCCGFIGSVVGLFFLGFGIWMLNRHVPEFHEWLVQLPELLRRAAETVHGWFAQKG